MNKFFVFEIFRQAPRRVFGNFGAIFRAILIPVALMTLLQVLGNSQLFNWIDFQWRRLMFGVGEWLIAAPFLAAFYRHVLSPGGAPLKYRLRRSDYGFYAYSAGFALALLSSVVAANTLFANLGPEVIRLWLNLSNSAGAGPTGIRASLLELMFLALVVAVWLRLIFVFPASATGEPLGLAGSWSISRNHHLKIFWVLLFVAMMFALIGIFVLAVILSLVTGALGQPVLSVKGLPNASMVVTLLLGNIYLLYAMAAEVTAVALMYRALKGYSGQAWPVIDPGEED
jgi:hypothetical protein